MKKQCVQGYIPAGQHRWKLVEKIVEVDNTIYESGYKDAAIDAWLMDLCLDGRKVGTPYEIKSVKEVDDDL